ncbi:MAG: zf-HC2 domain-containing protein, partial [Planctomycetota bacterium]
MNCPFTGNDWSALMDGELEESRRDAAMKHLQQCEHCSAEYQRLRDVNDRLAALQPPDPTRLLRSIAQLPERRNVVSPSTRPVKRWKSQFAMQAAGVLLAAATILLCIVCISAFST